MRRVCVCVCVCCIGVRVEYAQGRMKRVKLR